MQDRADTLDFPFETIAELFQVIETPLLPIIVPYRGLSGTESEVDQLIQQLRFAERPAALARRLQPFLVQIPPVARSRLISADAAEIMRQEEFGEQFVLLTNNELYSLQTGLSWDDPSFRRAEGLII